jgi:hypothetical protein
MEHHRFHLPSSHSIKYSFRLSSVSLDCLIEDGGTSSNTNRSKVCANDSIVDRRPYVTVVAGVFNLRVSTISSGCENTHFKHPLLSALEAASKIQTYRSACAVFQLWIRSCLHQDLNNLLMQIARRNMQGRKTVFILCKRESFTEILSQPKIGSPGNLLQPRRQVSLEHTLHYQRHKHNEVHYMFASDVLKILI